MINLFLFLKNNRYNAERLANNLPVTVRIDLNEPLLKEGYFPKLYNSNSGRIWGKK